MNCSICGKEEDSYCEECWGDVIGVLDNLSSTYDELANQTRQRDNETIFHMLEDLTLSLNDEVKVMECKIEEAKMKKEDESKKKACLKLNCSLDDINLYVKSHLPNCPTCKGKLGKIEHYPHTGGISVTDSEWKQWVYFTCTKCRYQWALWKLLQRIMSLEAKKND